MAMDTGSRYIWVIGNYSNMNREFIYSPYTSSTHSQVSCTICNNRHLPYSECNSNGNCTFHTRYGDGHTVRGYLGYDQFVFHNTIVKNVTMGTAYEGEGSLFKEYSFNGIFGLSPGFPSFVHKLRDLGANKFSYYINGKVSDNSHPHAGLTLGDMADVQGGTTTPLIHDGARYRVFLESITLGGVTLPIDARRFNSVSGVIIDTGTINTWLTDGAYSVLASGVQDLLRTRGFQQIWEDTNLCFYGSVAQVQKSDFPVLSFNFAEGASLKLDEDDLFIESGLDSFCMTVIRSSRASPAFINHTIIGLTAQQDYIMGYDLDNLRLSIKLCNL